MVDVIAAVDSATGAFGPLVQNRLHADMQSAIDSGVTTAMSATPAFVTAVGQLTTDALLDPAVYRASSRNIKADGTTDDSAAFASLLATAAGLGRPTTILFPTGKTVNLGSANFSIDISKVMLAGDRNVFTGTGTITLYSTAEYGTRNRNWSSALSGITLSGISLTIGSSTYTHNAMFRISDGGMIGGTLSLTANTWKVHFDHFHLTGTTWSMVPGVVNSGEAMVWRNSLIGDGSNGAIGAGDWLFEGCSFDNCGLTVTNASVDLVGHHFENPGNASTGFRFVTVNHAGSVKIFGGDLVLNNPASVGGSTWNMAPFYVDPAVQNRGLVIRGLDAPLQPFFTPEVGDKIRALVVGGGFADVDGITTYDSTTNAYALTESGNLIRNPGFEDGAANGWIIIGTGGSLIDTGYKNRGSGSLKIQAGSGQNMTVYQEFPVRAGKKLWAQLWQSFNAASGATLNTQINFYDRAGGQISTYGYDQLTSSTTRNRSFLTVCPAGAASARVTFYLVGGSSGLASMNLDDVIANIA